MGKESASGPLTILLSNFPDFQVSPEVRDYIPSLSTGNGLYSNKKSLAEEFLTLSVYIYHKITTLIEGMMVVFFPILPHSLFVIQPPFPVSCLLYFPPSLPLSETNYCSLELSPLSPFLLTLHQGNCSPKLSRLKVSALVLHHLFLPSAANEGLPVSFISPFLKTFRL